MYGFLLKKNFCDGWDNLLSLIVTNLILLFATAGSILLSAYLASNIYIQLLIYLVSFVVISILYFAYGDIAANIANFNSVHIVDYFKAIPGVLKDGALFGLMFAGIVWVSQVGISYYFFESQTMFGICLGAVIVWVDVILFLALQWFVPIRSLMHNNFKKCLKKCFLIFFDNKGFTLLVTLYNIVLIAFSILFIGFVPSFAGILVGNTNALRIRLYKYDYLEDHPELETPSERKQIPWEDLIYDDRELLGPRKLRSFIFPWKED